MEADLARFYHIDYRDRWRGVVSDRLTLRRLKVLVEHLPPDAAVWRVISDGKPHWGLEHRLLADIWQAAARSKNKHPLLRDAAKAAKSSKQVERLTPERRRKLSDARRRARERQRAIESGAIR